MKKPTKPIIILNNNLPTLRDIMGGTMITGEVGAGKTKPSSPTKKGPAKLKKK